MIQPRFENQHRHFLPISDANYNGPFKILEYDKDLSVSPPEAQLQYFMSEMNVRRRQVVCELNGQTGIICQAGAMQWIYGDIKATTGIRGVGDLAKKAFRGAVTKESVIKPEYKGTGYLVLEPTYKYILIEDVGMWDQFGGLVVEDGMFLATESTVDNTVVARRSLSSATLGGEGLFNCCLKGHGYAVLESNVPEEELIDIKLENETLKVDGNNAICWSNSLDFTVEPVSKNIIGSAASGEGLVNVYRGTGFVRMSPVARTAPL